MRFKSSASQEDDPSDANDNIQSRNNRCGSIPPSPGFLRRFVMYECKECGKEFKTTKAAENASYNGCPRCGGSDIDLKVCEPKK